MNKTKHCEYLFNSIESTAEELESTARKIRWLKSAVQNPNFTSIEDFKDFEETCIFVNKEMEKTFNRVRNSLKSIYEQVNYIYNGEE